MSWREAFLQASMTSWQLQLLPTIIAIVVGAIYLRGFIGNHRSQPGRYPWWRAWSFILGELVLLLSIFSPLDALGGFLLSAHMAQHFLLLMVVPPLLAA